MGFPAIHYGNFGDEKVSQSTKINGLPLGIKMVLPDGREFVHARAGGTALVAGKVNISGTTVQALADTLYAKGIIPSSDYAVGSTTLAFTAGGTTAVTANLFQDGYMTIANSIGTSGGMTHIIKSNNSCATGATLTVTLYETDGLKVAWAGGTTRCGFVENPLAKVEVSPTGTVSWIPVGVNPVAVSANYYHWEQTKGPAPVFTGGTVLRERAQVVASSAIVGAVVPVTIAATTALLDGKEGFEILGYGMIGAAASGYSTIYLTLS